MKCSESSYFCLTICCFAVTYSCGGEFQGVNFSRPHSVQIKHCLWVCPCRRFPRRSASELVDSSKSVTRPKVRSRSWAVNQSREGGVCYPAAHPSVGSQCPDRLGFTPSASQALGLGTETGFTPPAP